jgi:hypothetical protein
MEIIPLVNQTERLYEIEQILSESSVVPIETMLERLEISSATFKRDLAYLRDRLHAPVVWDRELGGYGFDGSAGRGTRAGPKHELPGLWLAWFRLVRLGFKRRVFRVGLLLPEILAARVVQPAFRVPALRSGSDGRLVGALVALAVGPADGNLVARLGAAELELQVRVFRYRRTPFRRQHGLAIVRGSHFLDEMGRYHLAAAVATQAGFHFMGHQYADDGLVAFDLGANAHRVCHDVSSSVRMSVRRLTCA